MLQEVWRLSGQPSGKYLAAVMDDTLERLVRFRELGKVAPRVTDQVLDELRAMSPATIDRYLKPHKDAAYPVALSGTKPSHILRSSIPTRTSMDTPLTVPGFLELDTVAHCGHTLKGEFLRTLTGTDPVTGWTMLRTIRNNAYLHVHGALEWIRAHAPVPVAGIDFDNGSEFINWGVIAWADKHQIPLTRGRPKNTTTTPTANNATATGSAATHSATATRPKQKWPYSTSSGTLKRPHPTAHTPQPEQRGHSW